VVSVRSVLLGTSRTYSARGVACTGRGVELGLRLPAAPVESSRASPPLRPREDGLNHPADTLRTNLADALALLSRWLGCGF
jgi:hypothetical protein